LTQKELAISCLSNSQILPFLRNLDKKRHKGKMLITRQRRKMTLVTRNVQDLLWIMVYGHVFYLLLETTDDDRACEIIY
jgi:hypothetical protein